MASFIRFAMVPLLVVAPATVGHAAKRLAAAESLGTFSAWTAASASQQGETLCYAFTAHASPWSTEHPAVLSVSKFAGDDSAALSLAPGFPIPDDAKVTVSVGAIRLAFVADGPTAFARDTDAAVRAFRRGRIAVARLPGPNDRVVTDHFSLMGFAGAYSAVAEACQE